MLDRLASPSRRSAAAGIALAALALLAVLVPLGRASANTIAGGETRLRLDSGLSRVLKADGVRIASLKPATLKGKTVGLPIAEGQVDGLGRGSMRHQGGIKFKAGKRVATLKKVFLHTTKQALTATIGKRSLKVASTPPQATGFDGFDLEIAIGQLKLTQKAASLLNRKLGLAGVFKPGYALGTIANTTELESMTVAAGTIALAFDPAFQAKLESVEVAATPFESTKVLSAAPAGFLFDVRHGQVAPDLACCALVSEGGFYLKQQGEPGAPEIGVTSFGLTLDSRLLNGNVIVQPRAAGGAGPLASIDLAGAASAIDAKAGSIAVTGASATLTQGTAEALNETFAKPKGKAPLFAAGEPLGRVDFAIRTR
jgi:hypothetical protein